MSITLKHLSGAIQGQEQTFGDDHERIVIGRDVSQCDVVFPADLTIVGREHCALVRQISGEYELDLIGEHYVEIDGQPALSETGVHSGATLTFGRHDGPKLTATVDRSNVSASLSKTVAQQVAPSLGSLTHRTRVVAGVVIALALIVGIGLAWQAHRLSTEEAAGAALIDQMSALTAEQKTQAAQQISSDVRTRLGDSVYAVVLRDASGSERLLGTCWPVKSHALATNAHVAAEFAGLKPGEAMVVRPPGSSNDAFVIKTVTIHPGYQAFNSFVNNDALLVKNYGGWGRVSTIGGYDVALLNIDETIPSSAVLQVADHDELEHLKTGDPLAYAGFPYENIQGDTVQPMGRTPLVQVGNVTAMTDYFLLPTAYDQRFLIEHNLPATGGASGSPLVNSAGHVVALLSDVTMTALKDQRIPSAALINYGQRVDVLSSLIDGQADTALHTDLTYWKRQTAGFERGADIVIKNVLSDAKPAPNAKPILDLDNDFQITTTNRYSSQDAKGNISSIRYKMVKINPAPGSRHFVIAYGKDFSPIAAISLVQDGKVLQRSEGGGSSWAGIDYTAPGSGDLAILVEMADSDIELVVRDYAWDTSGS